VTGERIIEFFFDIGSPYSYLAATQVEQVGRRTDAEIRWRPFLLGGVFKSSGNPAPAAVAAKVRYMVTDLERWAAHYGVPFKLASRFPLNTLQAQRVLIAAGRSDPHTVPPLSLALFEAYWADDRDISDIEEIARIADTVGLDGRGLAAMGSDPAVKDQLKAVTAEAVERGAFGAPTFFVGSEMFFGNDRLDFVERACEAL
jgi:2-hydroxychromene-2-carboxylate isomerase